MAVIEEMLRVKGGANIAPKHSFAALSRPCQGALELQTVLLGAFRPFLSVEPAYLEAYEENKQQTLSALIVHGQLCGKCRALSSSGMFAKFVGLFRGRHRTFAEEFQWAT